MGIEMGMAEPRYVPDPNRPGGQLKRPGVDIIRTPTTPSEYREGRQGEV